jgi:hypothetical protein
LKNPLKLSRVRRIVAVIPDAPTAAEAGKDIAAVCSA